MLECYLKQQFTGAQPSRGFFVCSPGDGETVTETTDLLVVAVCGE